MVLFVAVLFLVELLKKKKHQANAIFSSIGLEMSTQKALANTVGINKSYDEEEKE